MTSIPQPWMVAPLTALALILATGTTRAAELPRARGGRAERYVTSGPILNEDVAAETDGSASPSVRQAPTGFDNLTNGYLEQGPPFDELDEDAVEPLRSFNDNRFIFEEVETVGDGLGPVYNGQSCAECHQNVVTGGASQVAEHRTGRLDAEQFFESTAAR